LSLFFGIILLIFGAKLNLVASLMTQKAFHWFSCTLFSKMSLLVTVQTQFILSVSINGLTITRQMISTSTLATFLRLLAVFSNMPTLFAIVTLDLITLVCIMFFSAVKTANLSLRDVCIFHPVFSLFFRNFTYW
jgi:hypothetical protein